MNYDLDNLFDQLKPKSKEERKEVISEAKEVLDVEDIISSILIADDLRVQKD